MRFLTKVLFTALLFQVPSALAQQVINGRFYAETEQYLVGEPIIVDFQVVNGSDKVAEIGEDNCSWMDPRQFEVDGAAPKKASRTVHVCGPRYPGRLLGNPGRDSRGWKISKAAATR